MSWIDDEREITRRVHEYAHGIDGRDWALYRSIFADEVAIDFSSYDGRPGSTMTADAWLDRVRPLFTGLDATQHSMTTALVDPDGDDRARCRMYVTAVHVLDGREFTLGGCYDDQLVRTDDGWRLDAVTLDVRWRRGDESIMREALER